MSPISSPSPGAIDAGAWRHSIVPGRNDATARIGCHASPASPAHGRPGASARRARRQHAGTTARPPPATRVGQSEKSLSRSASEWRERVNTSSTACWNSLRKEKSRDSGACMFQPSGCQPIFERSPKPWNLVIRPRSGRRRVGADRPAFEAAARARLAPRGRSTTSPLM